MMTGVQSGALPIYLRHAGRTGKSMSALSGSSPAMLHGIRGVILDLDGTMLDTSGDLQQTINRMRDDLALVPLAPATITSFVGKGAEHLVRCALRVDLPADETEQ